MWSRQFRVILSSAQSFTSIWWIAGTSRQTHRKTIHRKMDINKTTKRTPNFLSKIKADSNNKKSNNKKNKKSKLGMIISLQEWPFPIALRYSDNQMFHYQFSQLFLTITFHLSGQTLGIPKLVRCFSPLLYSFPCGQSWFPNKSVVSHHYFSSFQADSRDLKLSGLLDSLLEDRPLDDDCGRWLPAERLFFPPRLGVLFSESRTTMLGRLDFLEARRVDGADTARDGTSWALRFLFWVVWGLFWPVKMHLTAPLQAAIASIGTSLQVVY